MDRTTDHKRNSLVAVVAAVTLATISGPTATADPARQADYEMGRGVGIPVRGMRSVTDADGNLTLRPISERLAFRSCRPLMRELAPDLPPRSWKVSEGWADDFPSHATRLLVYEHDDSSGEPTHFLNCFMPGTYQPKRATAADTSSTEDAGVRSQCAALAHIDFTHWTVAALDQHDGVTSASLVAPNGFAAGCVLGSDPALPLVWIPQRRPKPSNMVYVQFAYPFDKTEVGIAGLTRHRVVRAVLTAASGEQMEVTLRDGWFAAGGQINGPLLGDGMPLLEGFDEAGHLVWSRAFGTGMLPAECMSSFEERHGC